MERISADQVRAQVHKFWHVLSGQSKDSLEELYSPEATVITGKAKRSERVHLAVARRKREIAQQVREASVELGAIDVEVVGDDVAVASYTYKFLRVRRGADASEVKRHTPYGRATHVLQRDTRGALRIVHEHLSSAAPAGIEPTSKG